MASKIFWTIWSLFLIYSIFVAPKTGQQSESTGVYVKKLMFEPWNNIDPYVISLFYLLGVWPLVYMSILLVDGQKQPFNGTLASLLSMVLGGFILLPYFALRRSDRARKFKLNFFVRIFDSKLTAVILMVITIALILFALIFGDFRIFLHEFHSNRFIHVMSIDFFVVSFLFPFLIEDDLKRREMTLNNEFQRCFSLCFVPLIGPLIYLYHRQSLPQQNNKYVRH